MKTLFVILACWCLCISHLAAEIPIEREQEFTYYWYAAKHAVDTQRYPEALMLFRFCEQINPNDGKTLEFLGVIYEALQRHEQATRYFQRAYEADATLWRRYAESRLRQGVTDKKERKQLLRIIEGGVKADSQEPENWDFLRQVYTSFGQYSQAIHAQDKMDAIMGYDAYSAINRYRIYAIAGDAKRSLREIERYLDQDPTDIRFVLFKVELLEYMHAKWSTLEQAYQQVLALEPNHMLTLNNYAYGLAIRGGDIQQAERMSRRTIQAEPENAIYLDTYAWILHLQGQNTLAEFYIHKALKNAGEKDQAEIERHYREIVGK